MEMRALLLLWPLALSLALGCTPEAPTPVPTPAEVLTLELELAGGPFEAGVAYPYRVVLRSSHHGDISADAEVSLVTNPGADVTLSPTTLTFALARDYNLTYSATYEGQTYGDSRGATVVPGSPAALTLGLNSTDVRAGAPVNVSAALVDAFGNVADPSPTVALTLSPSQGVTLSPPSITVTKAGDYTLSAHYSPRDLAASLSFTARPGPAAQLFLEASTLASRPGEPVTLEAHTEDAFGNPTDVSPTLSTEPSTGARVNGQRVIFSEEGIFTILGSINDGEGTVAGEVGPVVVDGTPPTLIITEPARGTYRLEDSVHVEGQVTDGIAGVASLSLLGQPLTLDDEGRFAQTLPLLPGINALTFTATDRNGNRKEGVRSVLFAEAFAPMGARVQDAFYGRLGQESIDELSLLLEDELSLETMSEWLLAENPIEAYNETATVLGKEYTTSAFINLLELRYTEVIVEMIPRSGSGDGHLDLSVTFNDLGATLEAYGELANDPYTLCGELQTDFGLATGKARATFDADGHAVASLDDVIVNLTGFEMRMCDDSLQALLALIEEEVQGELEDLLKDLILDELTPELESLIDSLILSEDFELEGVPMHLDAALTGMRFDDRGATLWMWSGLTTEAYPGLPENPGVPLTMSTPPDYDGAYTLYISANDDLLNQLFYTLWAAGTLHLEYDAAELGLTPEQIGLLFDGATVATFRMIPPLPPVLQYTASEGYLMDAALGDCLIEVLTDATTGDPSNLALDYALAATAVAPATAFAPQPNILAVEIGTPALLKVEIAQNLAGLPISEETLNLVLGTAVGALLGDLNASMAEIPIPAIEGYALEVSDLYMDGAAGDYLTLGGDLIAPGDWTP